MYLHLKIKNISIVLVMVAVLLGSCGQTSNKETSAPAETSSESGESASCEYKPIEGKIADSSEWESGWIDLSEPQSFQAGDKIKFNVGGAAKKVVLRLIPSGGNPNNLIGVVNTFPVPEDRVLEVKLDKEYSDIVHISLHGGPKPFNKFDLAPGNGAATIKEISQCS